MKQTLLLFLFILMVFGPLIHAQPKSLKGTDTAKPLITFVELGSVKCIPCKAMQPVMKAIEERYGTQIKVIFYDVWKQEQAHYAKQFNVRLIPTQVFLDSNGKELLRHEGFFPEREIDALLQARGLKPQSLGKR